jgi:hypothetical protein
MGHLLLDTPGIKQVAHPRGIALVSEMLPQRQVASGKLPHSGHHHSTTGIHLAPTNCTAVGKHALQATPVARQIQPKTSQLAGTVRRLHCRNLDRARMLFNWFYHVTI